MARRLGPHRAQLHLQGATPPRSTAPWWPRCPDIRTDSDDAGRAAPGAAREVGSGRGVGIGKWRSSTPSSGAPATPARHGTTSSSGSPTGCASSASTATGWTPPSTSSEAVSAELKREAEAALADWRRANPAQVSDGLPFYMVGEVYGWEPGQGRDYDFGDRTVDYLLQRIRRAHQLRLQERYRGSLDGLFTRYSATLTPRGTARRRRCSTTSAPTTTASPYDRDRKDPVRRRDPSAPGPGRRPDLLRRRAGAAASGRGRRG